MEPTNCIRTVSRPVVVLFLHGSGDSGPAFRHTLDTIISPETLTPHNSLLLFPTARKRPYTPMMGLLSNVWFDRPRLHYDAVEDSATLADSILALEQTLKEAVSSLPNDSLIFFVGFSMGGSMALHLAFHVLRKGFSVHGVFVHSSFMGRHSNMIPDSTTVAALDQCASRPALRVFFVHGSHDTLVPCEWGRLTAERLRKSGYSVDFREVPGLRHEISSESLCFLRHFIRSAYTES